MRYVIFGDSFADNNFPNNEYLEKRWSNLLDHPSKSYALLGSSIWYSIDEFFNYLKSDEYNKTDRIVFLYTHWSRAIRYTDNKFAKDHWRITTPSVNKPKTEFEKYQYKNKDVFKYIINNVITNDMVTNIVSMLESYLNNITNDTLLLPCYTLDEDELLGSTRTSYFSLAEVSRREFKNEKEMNKTFKNTTDLRANHLTFENHKILANHIIEYFKTFDNSIFKIENFDQPSLTQKNYMEIYK
jgi:hypothetical protein